MDKKRCSMCGEYFPPTTQYFNRRSNSHDGLQYHCKACNRAAVKKFDHNHKRNKKLMAFELVFKKQGL